uniref:PHD-type domain-containing protein n=1 Tax=Trichobilharzia regenti TaxID=157069 RepID=A0AA85J8I3_TRIRE
MSKVPHKCNRAECYFLVDDGIQCNNCEKWYHKMCTGLRPAAYKRCTAPTSHWMCRMCCSPKMTLIREAHELLSKAMELPDDSVASKSDTDCPSEDEAVSAIMNVITPAVTIPVTPEVKPTRRSKRLSKRKGKKTEAVNSISEPENTVSEVHHEGGADTDLDCTIKNCSSPEKQLQTDDKWVTKISSRKKYSNIDGRQTSVTCSQAASIVVRKDVATAKYDKLSLDSNIIVGNLEESKESDPVKRHDHDLKLVSSIIRKMLPANFPGVSIKKLIRIGKRDDECSSQRRLLKVVLGSPDERNHLLANVHNLAGSGISARPDLSLEDRLKRKEVLSQLETRRKNGETNLKLVGFQIVRSWKRMLPRPVWISQT